MVSAALVDVIVRRIMRKKKPRFLGMSSKLSGLRWCCDS